MKREKKEITVGTSKKQILYAILELLCFVIGPLLAFIFEENIVIAFTLFSIIIVLGLTFCILCFINGRKNYKSLLRASNAKEDNWFSIFEMEMNTFKYEEATDLAKSKYMIYSMLVASFLEDCTYFYYRCYEFSKDDIKRLIEHMNLTSDLREFISEVLLAKKCSRSIYRFEPELFGLLKLLNNVEEKLDSLLFNKNVLYDPTKHYRYYVEKDDRLNDYHLVSANFLHETRRWETWRESSMYASFDLAFKDCKIFFNEKTANKDYDDFLAIEEYTKEDFNMERIWKLFFKHKLESKHYLIVEYYQEVLKNNHYIFLCNHNTEDYLECFKEYLPKALVEKINETIDQDNCYDMDEYAKECDERFKENKIEIRNVISSIAELELYKNMED